MSPPPPTPASQYRPGLEVWLVAPLLALLYLTLPTAPSAALDPSWEMVLAHALSKGWQFGKDLIFTYGPLSGVSRLTYAGTAFWPQVLWQLLATTFFATVMVLGVQSLPAWRRALVYSVLAVGSFAGELQMFIPLLVLALWLVRSEEHRDRATAGLRVAGAAALGILGNHKFTYTLFGLVAILALAGFLLWRRRALDALAVAAGFAGAFLVTWLLCGQHLSTLPAYLASSWAMANGYDAMTTYEPPAVFRAGVLALAAFAALLAVGAWRGRAAQTLPSLLLLTGGLYLAWKNGFVRADMHVLIFFCVGAFVASALPAWAPFHTLPRWTLPLQLAPLIPCAIGFFLIYPDLTPRSWPGHWKERLATNGHNVTSLVELSKHSDAVWRATSAQETLPAVKQAVGDARIDVLGFHQGIALFNNLNYAPRPIFQGYAAYAPALIRANRDYYRGDRAPAFVLAQMESIDYRLARLDDAPVWLELISRYQPRLDERGFSLWERRQDAPLPTLVPVRTVRGALGDTFSVADLAGELVWVEVRWGQSFRGRLTQLLYKVPSLVVAITDATGRLERGRLIRGMASEGFLLSPLVQTTDDWKRLATEDAGGLPSASSVRLELDDPTSGAYFKGDVELRLFRVQRGTRRSGRAGPPSP